MSEERIIETIGAIGQHLSDKIDANKQRWNPEANKYSRAINPSVLIELVGNHLKQTETFILLALIELMDSENKIGCKVFKKLNIPRTTLFMAVKRLSEKGCIYEFPDGNIMINPSIAMLTKYRKDCLLLKNIWNKQMKTISNISKEIVNELGTKFVDL